MRLGLPWLSTIKVFIHSGAVFTEYKSMCLNGKKTSHFQFFLILKFFSLKWPIRKWTELGWLPDVILYLMIFWRRSVPYACDELTGHKLCFRLEHLMLNALTPQQKVFSLIICSKYCLLNIIYGIYNTAFIWYTMYRIRIQRSFTDRVEIRLRWNQVELKSSWV